MKTTATISQEELEQKAVDSMIAYEKSLISGQEMKDAVTRALHHYANQQGKAKMAPAILDLEKRILQMSEELDALEVNVRNAEKTK